LEPLEFSLISTQELQIRPPAYACFERLTGIIVFTGIFKLIRPTFGPTGAFMLIRPTFRPTGVFKLVFISIPNFLLRPPTIALIGVY